jgi:hypothetical protein
VDHELVLLALPDVPQLAGDFANYAVIATLSAGLLTFLLRHRDRRIGRLYLGMRRRERLVVVHPAMLPHGSLQVENAGVADALAQGEVQAVKYITDFFAARLKHPKLTLRFPPAHVDVDGLLILLGGPRWNTSTSQLLAGLRAFEVNEEARTIRVPVLPELAEPSTEYDRALVLVGPNPFRNSGRFVLCCGLTTNSTEAMTRYLFEQYLPDASRNLLERLADLWRTMRSGDFRGKRATWGQVNRTITVGRPSHGHFKELRTALYWGLVANVNVSADGTAAVITDSVTAYSYSYDRVPSYQLLEVRHRDRSRTMTPTDGAYTFSMTANEKITLDITLRNNGDGSWQSDETFPIRLGTAVPNDRFSHFSTPEWTLPHRPADLGARIVVPGAVVTMPVTLRAPPAAGRHREAFQLIHELRTWCHGPVIRLDVTVESTDVAPAR